MEMNLKSLKNLSLETICTDIFDNYINVFKKVFNFKERAGKYEYWGFKFANEILFAIFMMISFIPALNNIATNISMAYGLLYLLPAIAVFIRRLHDTGRSALQLLYVVLFFIGGAVIAVTSIVLLQVDDIKSTSSLIGYIYGSLGILAIALYFFIIMMLPSVSDNKYGKQPEENSAQKTLANLFIIAVISLRILTAGISVYSNHPEWHSSNTAEPSAHIYSHIQ